MILKKEFFKNKGIFVAKELLGSFICIKKRNKVFKYLINETELYSGESDSASHVNKFKKKSNILYKEGGYIYIYICYGIHYMLNIVTGEKGYPESVFIRGIEGFDGPGKLTKKIGIKNVYNKMSLDKIKNFWFENKKYNYKILKLPRIGISYASTFDQKKLWRFKINI